MSMHIGHARRLESDLTRETARYLAGAVRWRSVPRVAIDAAPRWANGRWIRVVHRPLAYAQGRLMLKPRTIAREAHGACALPTRGHLVDRFLMPAVRTVKAAASAQFVADAPRPYAEQPLILPWNMGTHGTPITGAPYSTLCEPAMVRHYARAAGWLRAAARFPGLLRAMFHSADTRGEGSPRTKLCWVKIAFDCTDQSRPCVTPGKLHRHARRIQVRAQRILCAPAQFDREHTERFIARWRAIDLAQTPMRIGRAAVILAARKRILDGAWYPGREEEEERRDIICDIARGLCNYRIARAILALAAAPDPATVIEAPWFRPVWRASAYAHLSAALAARLSTDWPLAA